MSFQILILSVFAGKTTMYVNDRFIIRIYEGQGISGHFRKNFKT